MLVVDDEDGIRDLLTRWLRSAGYSVVAATTAQEAIDRMVDQQAAVAVCDVLIPGDGGIWLAETLRRQFPETAVVMATGMGRIGEAAVSFREGIVGCIQKPFERSKLYEAVGEAIVWHDRAVMARQRRHMLDMEVQQNVERLTTALASSSLSNPESFDRLLAKLTASDPAAYLHAQRVAQTTKRIARAMGISGTTLANLECAALFHDLGKLAMPRTLLRDDEPLTPEEEQVFRSVPEVGYHLLSRVRSLGDVAELVRAVTESYGGGGYPRGLRGENIPIGSRIIAVANAYDAATHPSTPRKEGQPEDVRQNLTAAGGSQLDPLIVDIFHRCDESEAGPDEAWVGLTA